MAFKFAFKPSNKNEAVPARPAPKPGAKPAPWAVPKAAAPGRSPGPTTVMEGPKRRMLGIGAMRVGQQYAILGSIFGALFIAAAVVVYADNRAATYGTVYISTSAQIRMLTQRIAKAAQTGLIGSPEAFKQLQQSRDEFITALKLLTQGGESGGEAPPPPSATGKPHPPTLHQERGKTHSTRRARTAQ